MNIQYFIIKFFLKNHFQFQVNTDHNLMIVNSILTNVFLNIWIAKENHHSWHFFIHHSLLSTDLDLSIILFSFISNYNKILDGLVNV